MAANITATLLQHSWDRVSNENCRSGKNCKETVCFGFSCSQFGENEISINRKLHNPCLHHLNALHKVCGRLNACWLHLCSFMSAGIQQNDRACKKPSVSVASGHSNRDMFACMALSQLATNSRCSSQRLWFACSTQW